MQCPQCGTEVVEIEGSSLSPYINTYSCPNCGWRASRCGNSSCDGYLTLTARVGASSARYTCMTCEWTGVGPG